MDKKTKFAITGAGLFAAGVGLGVVGIAFMTPAAAALVASLIDKGTDRLMEHTERASRTAGTIAGVLHRSFTGPRNEE